jgi:hypothetical protein
LEPRWMQRVWNWCWSLRRWPGLPETGRCRVERIALQHIALWNAKTFPLAFIPCSSQSSHVHCSAAMDSLIKIYLIVININC